MEKRMEDCAEGFAFKDVITLQRQTRRRESGKRYANGEDGSLRDAHLLNFDRKKGIL